MDNYFIEVYDKETNKEVFKVPLFDEKYDERQKQWHDAVLLGDTENKYGVRIWMSRDIRGRDRINILESLQREWNKRGESNEKRTKND